MMKKRIIACLLSIITVCVSMHGMVLADSGTYTLEENSVGIKIVEALGIIDQYDEEKTVSVGEFANAVNILSDTEDLAGLYFDESRYEKDITLLEAAAVICDLAGYGILLKDAQGQMDLNSSKTVAQKHGLMAGVTGKYEETLSQTDLILLSYNLLMGNAVETTYHSTDGVEIRKDDQKYMEKVLGLYLITGIVESTSYSSILDERSAFRNEVVIGGQTFQCAEGEYDDYIGMKVKALVKAANDGKYALMLYDISKCVTISARDLDLDSIDSQTITYHNDRNREITYKLSDTVDVLYNFSLLKDYTADDLKITQGRLVLIDNDDNGNYDVVKIEEYKSMQIFSKSTQSEMISDPYGTAVSIAELIAEGYPVYENGKMITAENIPLNAVATYYLNKRGQVARIYITNETAAGMVSRFEIESQKVMLSDKAYYYTDEVKPLLESAALGDVITVWLNHYGEITYIELSEDAFLYGYMISFAEGETFGSPKVKMFTQTNEIKVFETRSKMTFNGSSVSASKAFAFDSKEFSGLWDEAGKVSQIVRYKVNAEGQITNMMTGTTDPSAQDRLIKNKDDVYTYYATPKTLSSNTRLDINTQVFLIPTDLSVEERFRYGRHQLLVNDVDYTCQIFDIDENQNAGIVVARVDPYGKITIPDLSGEAFLISNSGRYMADNGEESVFVDAYGLINGNPVQLRFNRPDIAAVLQTSMVTADQLSYGDIIMVAYDTYSANEVTNFKLLYRNGETEPYEELKQTWYSAATKDMFISDGNTYSAGVIKRLIKNGIMLNNKPDTPEFGDEWDRVITTSVTNPVLICERGKVYKGSVSELSAGDKVFTQLRQALPLGFVIYAD